MNMSIPLNQGVLGLQPPVKPGIDTTPSLHITSQRATQHMQTVEENISKTNVYIYDTLFATSQGESTYYDTLIGTRPRGKGLPLYDDSDFTYDTGASCVNRELLTQNTKHIYKNITTLLEFSESEISSDNDSQTDDSSEYLDDLPLGAESTSFKFRPRSIGVDSGVGSEQGLREHVHSTSISVYDLSDQLRRVGNGEKNINKMARHSIDDHLLNTLSEKELKE